MKEKLDSTPRRGVSRVEQRNIYFIYYNSTLTLPDTSGEGEVAVEVVVAVRR